MDRKNLFLVLIIILFSGKILCQQDSYRRYIVINPKCKTPKNIKIHDNVLNRDFSYPINNYKIDFNSFNHGYFSNDKIFIIFQKNINSKAKYRQELWMFSKEFSSILMLGNFMDFIVDKDNKYLAVVDNNCNVTNGYETVSCLKIYDLSLKKIIKTKNISTNADMFLQPIGWFFWRQFIVVIYISRLLYFKNCLDI